MEMDGLWGLFRNTFGNDPHNEGESNGFEVPDAIVGRGLGCHIRILGPSTLNPKP